MAFFSQAWATVRKDLLTELRGASTIVSMVLMGLLVVLVFNFGTEPGTPSASLARAGVLWAAFLFSGVIAVGRVRSKKEAGCLDGLLLCPVDRGHLSGQVARQPDPGVRHRRGDPSLLHRRLQRGDRGRLAATAAAPGAGQRGAVDAGNTLCCSRGRGEGARRPVDRVHLPFAGAASDRRRTLLHPALERPELGGRGSVALAAGCL